MGKYAIGVDFGTLSARAVLVEIHTGKLIGQQVYEYPHGIMDRNPLTGEAFPAHWALQDPMDYLNGLIETVSVVMKASGIPAEDVVGMAVDETASTMLPVKRDKQPLCHTEAFAGRPHAYLKLWKHHGGEAEAAKMTEIARLRGEPWLSRYGGKISSEWMFPKILETVREDMDVYDGADYYLEAMDWLTWILTDHLSVSACGLGYKALCDDGKFPSREYFAAVDPRMADIVAKKLNMPVLPVGSQAGGLCAEMAEKLHLKPGTPVGTPIIDAHSAALGGGLSSPGEMMIIMGTSSCHMMLSRKDVRIPGIQGIVRDGILPGYYGIEAGQSCVGDLFAWTVKNCFPAEYAEKAGKEGVTPHEYLVRKLKHRSAGTSGLIALDWFNGVRSPLMDFDLNGLIVGLNLTTKPEDIYLALIEATAFGTRTIIDSFETAGVPVKGLILSGGIPAKNPFIVQTYADVLNRPVRICGSTQASALGAAMLGIAAAPEQVTGYHSLMEITSALGRVQEHVCLPDAIQAGAYNALYADYMELHTLFGKGGSDIMHRLSRRRLQQM